MSTALHNYFCGSRIPWSLLPASLACLISIQSAWSTPLFPVVPAGLQVTEFISGLNFPTSATVMQDGALLVGTTPSSGQGGFTNLYFGSGELLRVADSVSTVVAAGLPGAVTSVRQMGPLVVAATTGHGGFADLGEADLTFLRPGAGPNDPYTNLGSVHFSYPPVGVAPNIAMDIIATQGSPGSYDIYFSLGAGGNDGTSVGNVALTGLFTGTQSAGSLVRMTVATGGPSPSVTSVQQVANGIRNSGGVLINQATGDVYFSDNGFEDAQGNFVSADEINVLTAAQIASNTVVSFGYPGNYSDYATGAFVGGSGVQAIGAFRPTAGGASLGINELAFAPSAFPSGLNQGIFAGFDGNFSLAGPTNDTNPVILFNPATGTYSYFVDGGQPGVGHLIGVASTSNALFLLDLTSVDGWNGGTGTIYRIGVETPEPATGALFAAGLLAAFLLRCGMLPAAKRSDKLTIAWAFLNRMLPSNW